MINLARERGKADKVSPSGAQKQFTGLFLGTAVRRSVFLLFTVNPKEKSHGGNHILGGEKLCKDLEGRRGIDRTPFRRGVGKEIFSETFCIARNKLKQRIKSLKKDEPIK